MSQNGLSIVVHAHSKTGKSTFGATAPRPILILDAEGGTKFLPHSKVLQEKLGHPLNLVSWNPTEAPPDVSAVDGAVVLVTSWQDIVLASRWLQSGQHQFRSLIVDSITEVQRRLKANLKGTEALAIQDWGQLLTLMDAEIRGMRDLSNNPHSPIQVVVFIAETRETNGKWVPYLQGQISVSLPYAVDICGFLYVENVTTNDENGQPTQVEQVRRLLVTPHPQYEAGERVQGAVGPLITRPDVEQIFAAVYPNTTSAQEVAPV